MSVVNGAGSAAMPEENVAGRVLSRSNSIQTAAFRGAAESAGMAPPPTTEGGGEYSKDRFVAMAG
jgi:hypothetical protein